MSSTATSPASTPTELKRILSLPRRPVLNCERERLQYGDRRWAPEAQALVDLVTEKYTRGPRLACGCQKRTIFAEKNWLKVFRETREGVPPLPPVRLSVEEFCRDNSHNQEVCSKVERLRSGDRLEIPGLGRLNCVRSLHPVQAWILRELPQANGIFGFISVGGGKSFAGLLAPLAMPPHVKTVVLFVKPDQRLHYRNAYLQLREHFKVSSIIFDSTGQGSYVVPGTPVLHVIPYSVLSGIKSTTLLDMLNPDAVIADEAHLLSNMASSRTMRALRALQKRPDIIFCVWSGSLLKRKLGDVCHLAAHSLGLGSPYPIGDEEVAAWSGVIDPLPVPDRTSNLARSLRRNFGDGKFSSDDHVFSGYAISNDIREGHRSRVIETLGVVSTKSSSVPCSISIRERKVEKIPKAILEALALVRGSALRPDGEELVEAIDQIECAREVGAGFYSYWAFPKGEPAELIDKWYAARKPFYKELRVKLRNGEPHLDSKKLCENAAERAWRTPRYTGELPVWPAETWMAWEEVRHLVEPDPRTKWIDDYLARDAATWAKEHVGIVWCQSVAFGKKVADLAGIPYHGGGPECEARILSETGKRSIVASLNAHGESRDGMQFKFSKQLLAEMLASGDRWEQFLGRLAREGQEADTVETWVYRHISESRDAFRKAIMLAEFIESETPNRQLLLAADCDFSV